VHPQSGMILQSRENALNLPKETLYFGELVFPGDLVFPGTFYSGDLAFGTLYFGDSPDRTLPAQPRRGRHIISPGRKPWVEARKAQREALSRAARSTAPNLNIYAEQSAPFLATNARNGASESLLVIVSCGSLDGDGFCCLRMLPVRTDAVEIDNVLLIGTGSSGSISWGADSECRPARR
jgi:hypothetical protein